MVAADQSECTKIFTRELQWAPITEMRRRLQLVPSRRSVIITSGLVAIHHGGRLVGGHSEDKASEQRDPESTPLFLRVSSSFLRFKLCLTV